MEGIGTGDSAGTERHHSTHCPLWRSHFRGVIQHLQNASFGMKKAAAQSCLGPSRHSTTKVIGRHSPFGVALRRNVGSFEGADTATHRLGCGLGDDEGAGFQRTVCPDTMGHDLSQRSKSGRRSIQASGERAMLHSGLRRSQCSLLSDLSSNTAPSAAYTSYTD